MSMAFYPPHETLLHGCPPARQRVASVFLPTLGTDRLRRRAGARAEGEAPFATVRSDGGRRLLACVDDRARRCGLAPGMTAVRAHALAPGLALADHDPAADREALETIGRWLLRRYSPVVGIDDGIDGEGEADGLRLDIAGSAHLFGGEVRLVADLAVRLARSGFAARVAVADTAGAAHALARFGSSGTVVVPPGEALAALSGLPVAALRLPPAAVEGLERMGLVRIGQLYGMPRAPLVRRFGEALACCLDRAAGARAEPFTRLDNPELLAVRRRFAEPIADPGQILHQVQSLCARLADRLAAAGAGARRLDLVCGRVDRSHAGLSLGLSAPVRDPRRLSALLQERLALVDPGFGIEDIQLAAPQTEAMAQAQIRLGARGADGTDGRADLAMLVDRLHASGKARLLFRLAARESDLPERSFVRVDALTRPPPGTFAAAGPVRLLAHPEPVSTLALLPDYPPRRFAWRGHTHDVRHADGPERIYGEWWRAADEGDAVRDYFIVEDTAGHRFWLFRAGDGEHGETGPQRWFIHGLFG
ncbi:protein ImuB [Pseudochelatococcus lubricantis]|uniref:Protein ImuB n=1 Tax=Pseudochelatococcus lubricantis TaxID=1538102 RepID=A0ABX0UVJ7_9HYPH|nr:protein ImuB [Pseudochelatococcus lubricantis]